MSKDFSHLIRNWPRDDGQTSIGTFAEDINVPYQHAATMAQRNSVAPEFWPLVLKAAKKRGKPLSHEQLLLMRESRHKRTRVRPKQRASAHIAA